MNRIPYLILCIAYSTCRVRGATDMGEPSASVRHLGIYARHRRRIHQRYVRDVFPTVISALGYLWGWGKIQFPFRVTSLPGDNPESPISPILDPTDCSQQEPRF